MVIQPINQQSFDDFWSDLSIGLVRFIWPKSGKIVLENDLQSISGINTKFLDVNEKALEWIDHPFPGGMFRLQFDNDNNRRGNDTNYSKEKTLTNDKMMFQKMTMTILIFAV